MQSNFVAVGTIAAAACLSLLLISRTEFKDITKLDREDDSSKLMASTLRNAASLPTASTPVVIVNRLPRTLPNCGFGIGRSGATSFHRVAGERCYRKGQYKKAANYFKEAVKVNERDPRSLLGLGNSLIRLGKFKEAIRPLCVVRNDCHYSRCAAEKNEEDSQHDGAFKPDDRPEGWDQRPEIDGLPKQAREALDHEARLSLEAAVLKVAKSQGFKPDSATAEFKNERHYLVLKSSLQLAQQYHTSKNVDEAAALFRLAQENTRNLPSELIAELNVPGPRSQRWSKLARLALNAATPEEKDWYIQELKEACKWLDPQDIRVAAAIHYDAINHVREFGRCDTAQVAAPFEAQHPTCTVTKTTNEITGKHMLFDANKKYDDGILAYDADSLDQARNSFTEALTKFEALKQKDGIADTNYNLGCIAYSQSDALAAKNYFKCAALSYRDDRSHRDDEAQASYNMAALAVDGPVNGDDEPFLRSYDDRFQTIESATLFGLFLYKLHRESEALEPLKRAATISQAPGNAYPSPGTFPDTSEKIIIPDDKNFSDDEVYELLFKRFGRIDHYVNSRWSPMNTEALNIVRRGNLLSHDRQRYYQGLSDIVYRHALVELKKFDDLNTWQQQTFKTTQGSVSVDLPPLTEKEYLNTLQQLLSLGWYCPIEESDQHALVRLWISSDGQLIVRSIEGIESRYNDMATRLKQERLRESIANEALKWATPMPPPPVALANREIIVIFDSHKATVPECHAAVIPIICPDAVGPPTVFRW